MLEVGRGRQEIWRKREVHGLKGVGVRLQKRRSDAGRCQEDEMGQLNWCVPFAGYI